MQAIRLNVAIATSYLFISYATEWWANTLAVWPASGLALASLMVFGGRVWPGLWLGSFVSALLHFTVDEYQESLYILLIPFLTACGNTAGVVLANKLSPIKFFYHTSEEEVYIKVLRYLAALIVASSLSALFGFGGYTLLYDANPGNFYSYFVGWFTADFMGIVAFSPFFYFFYESRYDFLKGITDLEFVVSFILVSVLVYYIYGPGFSVEIAVFLQPSLILIPILWFAFRKPKFPLAFMNASFFLFAWWSASYGFGYFDHFFGDGSLTAMQLMLCSYMLSVQVLELLIGQRKYELFQQQEKLRLAVIERTAELEAAKESAELLARTDVMTGLNNRRAFFEYGSLIERTSKRSQQRFSVLMIDIDNFKRVNDRYGHDIGDDTIVSLARCIRSTVRESDVAARVGGEEFSIILPQTSIDNAILYATRLRDRVAQEYIETPDGAFQYTVSIGVSELSGANDNLNLVLKNADEALYVAKNEGRDCIRTLVVNI